MLLPIDQGIEHGPRDFFPNPASKDPDYQFRLAAEAGYSAIACQIGIADEVLPRLRRPGAADPQGQRQDRHPVRRRGLLRRQRLGRGRRAARRRRDRLHALRRLAAPGRGPRASCARSARTATATACRWSSGPTRAASAVEAKGGQNSFYAIDYAARMAMEMGADIVKLNMPKIDPDKDKDAPAPYNEMEVDQEEAIRQCVECAGRSLVVLSGGSKDRRRDVLEQTRMVMEAGGSGVIYGRNVWQRERDEAMKIIGDQGDAGQERHPHAVVADVIATNREAAWVAVFAALVVLAHFLIDGGSPAPSSNPSRRLPRRRLRTATRAPRRRRRHDPRARQRVVAPSAFVTSASTRPSRSSPTRRLSASATKRATSTSRWSTGARCAWCPTASPGQVRPIPRVRLRRRHIRERRAAQARLRPHDRDRAKHLEGRLLCGS